MFWVVQENIRNEDHFGKLIEQLDIQKTPYQLVKVVPFVGDIEPDINPEGLVFVSGAYSMEKLARKKGWVPGYFNQNLEYTNLLRHYGEHMLNSDAKIGTFDKLIPPSYEFFIRPVKDSKSFSGQVMNLAEFEEWRDKVIAVNEFKDSHMTLRIDDKILVAPLKEIYVEYRFFVIDGKVITQSEYKRGNYIKSNARVDQYVIDFAQKMVELWQPNRAFDLDIAETNQGLKVLEINAINAAGFYHCDMGKFVHAINSMAF